MECYKYIVHGKVQGVFFRASTVEYIMQTGLNLKGYVRNLPSGDVEVLAQGESQELSILKEWLQKGPSQSRVSGVDVMKLDHFDQYFEFKIKY